MTLSETSSPITRRGFLGAIAAGTAAGCAPMERSQASPLGPFEWESQRARDLATARLLNSASGDKAAYTWFGGQCFAVRGDLEPVRLLFGLQGVFVTRLGPEWPARLDVTGEELWFYTDPDANAILETWENPYTSEERQVEPVRQALRLETDPGLLPWLSVGDKAIAVLERHTPSGPDSGDLRRDSSSRQFVADRSALTSPDVDSVPFVGTWQMAQSWPAWMNLDDASGYLFSRLFMRKASAWDELPDALLKAIDDRYGSLPL